jgi:endonuclease-8
MPEGDTIFRTAVTLSRVLNGKTIEKCRSFVSDVRPESLQGKTVSNVESKGKNLLIHFSNGYVLHTHMRMSGSWHIYRIGEKWRRPRNFARLMLQVKDFQAVCFSAPIVRLFTEKDLHRDEHLRQLGPDVLKPEQLDLVAIRERFREYPELQIGEALLRQHLLSGIGNIYKNESLFLEKISPFESISDLSDSDVERLIGRAASLMAQAVNQQAKPRYWVYKRNGKACKVCGEIICMRPQGIQQRSSYYCPGCQKLPRRPDAHALHAIDSEP